MAGRVQAKAKAVVAERFRAAVPDAGDDVVLVRVEPKVSLGGVAVFAGVVAALALVLGVSIAPLAGGLVVVPGGGALFWWTQRRKGGLADSFRAAGGNGWLAVTATDLYTIAVGGRLACRVSRSRLRSAAVVDDHLDLVFDDDSTRSLTIKGARDDRQALAEAVSTP